MPKSIQNIIRFEGGLNTYSDARDIGDQESPKIVNFDVRKIGRLRLLGAFTDFESDGTTDNVSTVVDDLLGPDTGSAPSFNNLDWGNGEELFVFKTDTQESLDVLPETWIVFVDRKTSDVYMHSGTTSAGSRWKNTGDAPGGNWIGLKGQLATTALATQIGESACYYVADGKLRVCNPNFGHASFVGDGSTNFGASSLWIGSINKKFLSNAITVNKYCVLPAKIITPSGDTFMSESSSDTHGTNQSIDTDSGKFSFEAYLERGSGDGTLKMLGRKVYVTYTYDGMQESLPYNILTIDQDELDTQVPAPTVESLGYTSWLQRPVEYGDSTIYLRSDVKTQGNSDATKKNWEDDGEITVTDDTGQVQTLLYANVMANTEYTITNIDKDASNIELDVSGADAEIEVGDVIKISGLTNSTTAYGDTSYSTYFNETLWVCKTISSTKLNISRSWSGTALEELNTWTGDFVPTGTPKVKRAGCYLTGVTGWLDSGYCSVNYCVDEVVVTDGGSWAAADKPTTVTFSAPNTPALDGDVTATGTVTTDTSDGGTNYYIKSITMTNFGSGYAAPPTITNNGSNVITEPEITVGITGKLSTESLCANKLGLWAPSDLGVADWADYNWDDDAGTPNLPAPTNVAKVTYDPAGEIEEQDDNLGLRISLSCNPKYSTGGDHSTTPTDWGNTIVDYKYGGPRLTHVNFYTNKYEDSDGDVPQNEDYAYLGSFDLNRGYLNKDGTVNTWAQDDTFNDQMRASSAFFGTQLSENYQMRTGVFPDSQHLDIRWKTAVVLNRRVYAGNVFMKDDAGNERHYPDRIMKSIPNSFDIFPSYDSIDTVVDDGDEIVKLETFGGRLLQFKKDTLYVIDVTQMPEFLAGTFRFRGIPSRHSAAVTDEGVVFANRHGVFLYNGDGCIPLSKAKIEDTWSSFYDSANPPIVGYIAEHNIALITKGNSASFLYYDFLTKSFTEGNGGRYSDRLRTNFFTLDNQLYQGIESSGASDDSNATYKDVEFKMWDDSYGGSATDECIWESKEFDFGDPTQDSVLYNVKVTYKTAAAAGTDIEGTWKVIYNTGTGEQEVNLTATFQTTNNKWTTVKFKPVGGNLHMKTLRLNFTSTEGEALDSGFEINDMCIIYRNKSVK